MLVMSSAFKFTPILRGSLRSPDRNKFIDSFSKKKKKSSRKFGQHAISLPTFPDARLAVAEWTPAGGTTVTVTLRVSTKAHLFVHFESYFMLLH